MTAIKRLAGLGVTMAAIYLLAFTLPYNLLRHAGEARQTIGSLGSYTWQSGVLYLSSVAALFSLYWHGWRNIVQPLGPDGSGRIGRRWTLLILGGGLAFNLILLAMYPVNAVDIYENILRGRIQAVYHLNPFIATPNQIPLDPFYRFSVFRGFPSPYGPLWETLAGLASRVAGDGLLANLFVFKGLSILGYLAAAALIGLSLRRLAPRRVWIGMYLFAWNPLVVLMTGGTGHNDPLMAAFMLLSLYFLVERRFTLSTLAAIAGGLVKFIPFMLVSLIAIIALRSLPPDGRRAYLSRTALLGLLLVGLAYAPYLNLRSGPGVPAAVDSEALPRVFLSYMISGRTETFTGSIATLVRQMLIPRLDGQPPDAPPSRTPRAGRWVANGTLALFGLYYLYAAARLFQQPDPAFAIQAWTKILIVYLLVAAVWFQVWYVIWVVAVAALLAESRLQRLALLFSYLVTWQPFLYNYITLRPGRWAPLPWRDLLPVAAAMGSAAVYWIGSRIKGWMAARQVLPLQRIRRG